MMNRKKEQMKVKLQYPVEKSIIKVSWSKRAKVKCSKIILVNHPNENRYRVSFHYFHQSCMNTEVIVWVMRFWFDLCTSLWLLVCNNGWELHIYILAHLLLIHSKYEPEGSAYCESVMHVLWQAWGLLGLIAHLYISIC